MKLSLSDFDLMDVREKPYKAGQKYLFKTWGAFYNGKLLRYSKVKSLQINATYLAIKHVSEIYDFPVEIKFIEFGFVRKAV